jgi:hypothetical protein
MRKCIEFLAVYSLFAFMTLSVLLAAEADKEKGIQENPEKIAIIDPGKVDVDFAIQGEYSGIVVDDGQKFKAGVQVIALGDHKFRAIAYPGGLPGDGWNKQDVIIVEGETKDGRTTMTGPLGSGVVTDGSTIQINNKNGEDMGTIKKIVRKSPTLGRKPPEGAVVLFDGTSAEAFKDGQLTGNGLLKQGTTSLQTFHDCTLHLEFMLSYMPSAREQARSNSGCYLQGRYEVQILDSFGLEGKKNECGAIYDIRAPSNNMCFPPLSWQTYDIDFTAAKYDQSGVKYADAKMTVRHNGLVIQKDVSVPNPTRAAPNKEGPDPGPIFLQDHGNPLRFRNIWVV